MAAQEVTAAINEIGYWSTGYSPDQIHPRTVSIREDGNVVGRKVLSYRPSVGWCKVLSDGTIVGPQILLGHYSDITYLP